jgi:hypothetical protein
MGKKPTGKKRPLPSSGPLNTFCEKSGQFVKPIRPTRIPRKDRRLVDLISDALAFGRLWYGEPDAVSNAIGYAMHRSRSHDAVIRVYDEAGNVIVFQRPVGTMMRPGGFLVRCFT